MEYRKLGNTDLRLSVLGAGCSRIGRSVFEDNRDRAHELLDMSFDAGINLYDTAPTYTYGDSERLLGRVFADRRDRVIFATKGGYRLSSYGRCARYLLPVIGPFRGTLRRGRASLKQRSRKRQDFSATGLRTQLEGSLRRLRTDYVDLYQLHSPTAAAIESVEVLRFLEDSTRQGKVRYCAASVNSVADALLCLKYPIYSALQIGFSLAQQAPAAELFALASAQGVGIVVKTPLSRGLLTDSYHVATGPRPEQPEEERRARRRQALAFLVNDRHPTIAAAALRFVLDHADVTSALTGTSNPDHLRANIRAVEAGPLPDDVMRRARALDLDSL